MTTSIPVPIGDAVRYGWERMKERLGFWIVLQVIILALTLFLRGLALVPGAFGPIGRGTIIAGYLFSIIFSIIAAVISVLMSIGTLAITLKVCDGQPVTYGDLFARRDLFFRYLWGNLLYALIVALGFVLLIVPGFIFLIKYQFVPYLIVDRGAGASEALKMSAKLTAGVKLRLYLFSLALAGVAILGALALGVGVVVAVPVILMASVYMYRHRLAAAGGVTPAVQPAPVTP